MAWIISRNAREMGVITYCFSNAEQDYIHDFVDEFYNISIFEKEEILKQCKDKEIDGVIATTELTIPIASYVAEKLGLSGMSYDIACQITDKFRNRSLCGDVEEIKPIKFFKLSENENVDSLSIEYPIIVKPTTKGGKRGITVVSNDDELKMAVTYAREFSSGMPIIVEDYIQEGKEFSVESLSCNGSHYIIQITEKISSGAPHCVELGHHQPATLPEKLKEKIKRAVSKGLTSIGADNSAGHTEIKVVGEDVYVIEFNVRLGGDHISWPLTELSTGYNMVKGAIEIALGIFNPIDYSSFKHKYAGVYFVTQQTSYLKPIFDSCDDCEWLYHKNKVSDDLKKLEHNGCYETNSIMYLSDHKIEL